MSRLEQSIHTHRHDGNTAPIRPVFSADADAQHGHMDNFALDVLEDKAPSAFLGPSSIPGRSYSTGIDPISAEEIQADAPAEGPPANTTWVQHYLDAHPSGRSAGAHDMHNRHLQGTFKRSAEGSLACPPALAHLDPATGQWVPISQEVNPLVITQMQQTSQGQHQHMGLGQGLPMQDQSLEAARYMQEWPRYSWEQQQGFMHHQPQGHQQQPQGFAAPSQGKWEQREGFVHQPQRGWEQPPGFMQQPHSSAHQPQGSQEQPQGFRHHQPSSNVNMQHHEHPPPRSQGFFMQSLDHMLQLQQAATQHQAPHGEPAGVQHPQGSLQQPQGRPQQPWGILRQPRGVPDAVANLPQHHRPPGDLEIDYCCTPSAHINGNIATEQTDRWHALPSMAQHLAQAGNGSHASAGHRAQARNALHGSTVHRPCQPAAKSQLHQELIEFAAMVAPTEVILVTASICLQPDLPTCGTGSSPLHAHTS